MEGNIMNTLKLGIVIGAAFIAAQNLLGAASNDPTALLQKALFEEEANHNLPAAIDAYQSVITQFEKERKLAGTAVFRLGECYRKQGNTNDAVTQYQRILQEFSDQASLVTLSRQNLAGLSSVAPATTVVAGGTSGPANFVGSAPATSDEAEEVRRIQAMIKDSPDLIAAKDYTGRSPLHRAAEKGQLVVATFLLNNGAEVNSKDRNGLTPLHLATSQGHKAMIELLLDHQADVQASAYGNNEYTPLHFAAQRGYRSLLEVLLAHKAQVNAKASGGIMALHLAVVNGFKSIAEVLLSSGADVNAIASSIPNSTGVSFNGTPLHIAAARGDQAMAELLVASKADPNIKLDDGRTALHDAAVFGQDSVAKVLIGHGAQVDARLKSGWTALAFSVEKEFIPMAKQLLAAKADSNIQFETPGNGKYCQRTPLFLAVLKKNAELVDLLLKNGANPNVKDEAAADATPLLKAVQELDTDIVSLLLGANANPNLPDLSGWTPLHWAVGQPTVIEKLLSAKAEVDARNKMGETALHCAAGCGLKPATELLLDHGAEINARDNMGDTPLHLATLAGRTEEAEFLLTKGANPNLANNEGKTPLDWAKNRVSGFWVQLGGVSSFIRPQSSIPGMPPNGFIPGANSSIPGGVEGRTSIASALKSHGALEVLPQLDRIQVSRPSANVSQSVFSQGTNDWNQITLLEALAVQYQILTGDPNGESGSSYFGDAWAGRQSLPFPDLLRVRIRHPEPNLTSWRERNLDLSALLEEGDCTKDVCLAWGEVVQIPEADHPLNASWKGFSNTEFENLKKCLTREVQVTVKGRTTKLTLSPDIKVPNFPGQIIQIGTQVPFWIAPALRGAGLLLSSSDLARIKVTRHDTTTGQKREWVLDCSAGKPAPAFWLRNGDVIEVPEKN